MRLAAQICTLALAICLGAAANGAAPVGFVDLPRLLAIHPLHKVLGAYDREIAALRGTLGLSRLADPAGRAGAATTALRRDVAEAQSQVQRIASADDRYRALEGHALSAVAALRYGANDAMDTYAGALARETGANVRGYEAAIAQRTARAFVARQEQLRQKELALAYALAQRDAGAQLMLRVKLADVRIERTRRAQLETELAAIGRRESAAIAALHSQDAAVLVRYREQLERQAATAKAQMESQLRSKADANLALRRDVLRAAAGSAQVVPDLPSRLAGLRSSYRLESDAAAIRGNLQTAATEVPRRFAQLADTDRTSRSEVSAQLANLQRDRAQLYRAMVAQINRDAQRLGRERGLRGVVVSATRPRGGVDLTATLAREESGF
jgi:hypothetical protein